MTNFDIPHMTCTIKPARTVARLWRRQRKETIIAKKPVIVGPSGDGRWTVKSNGKDVPVSTHHKQSTAIDKAEKIAKEQKTELIIRGKDGQIRSKDSYGNDPIPPKDKEH